MRPCESNPGCFAATTELEDQGYEMWMWQGQTIQEFAQLVQTAPQPMECGHSGYLPISVVEPARAACLMKSVWFDRSFSLRLHCFIKNFLYCQGTCDGVFATCGLLNAGYKKWDTKGEIQEWNVSYSVRMYVI